MSCDPRPNNNGFEFPRLSLKPMPLNVIWEDAQVSYYCTPQEIADDQLEERKAQLKRAECIVPFRNWSSDSNLPKIAMGMIIVGMVDYFRAERFNVGDLDNNGYYLIRWEEVSSGDLEKHLRRCEAHIEKTTGLKVELFEKAVDDDAPDLDTPEHKTKDRSWRTNIFARIVGEKNALSDGCASLAAEPTTIRVVQNPGSAAAAHRVER